MPARNPSQYKFVQFDWNPKGHEPDSVYTFPHFDFHFYTVPVEVRNSILPSDPQYAATAAGAPAAAVTIPMMGLHWLDVRSPELQKLTGNPAGYREFTKTFIYGTW